MSQVLAFPSPPLVPKIRHPRTGFESLPRDLSRSELFRFFTFSDVDLEQIRLSRGDTSRLGFALMLGGVRLTGRFPYDLELVSPSLLVHVAGQLQISAPSALNYPQRRPTRHEHITRW